MKIIKIGSVELTEQEAAAYYQQGKYICTSTAVWQIHYSQAQNRYYGTKLFSAPRFARRGRYHALDAETINGIMGRQMIYE